MYGSEVVNVDYQVYTKLQLIYWSDLRGKEFLCDNQVHITEATISLLIEKTLFKTGTFPPSTRCVALS
jgi:hypothetical protein